MYFNTPFGLNLHIDAVAKEIVGFMKSDEKRRYKVVIGSDSEKREGHRADFVTAIIVHRVGNGGRYFWRRLELDKIHNLRNRIIQEVVFSLEAAQKILVSLKEAELAAGFSAPIWDFEIHADVGENGETKTMIAEIVGMIRAHNFEARTKPESYAASKVADRHV